MSSSENFSTPPNDPNIPDYNVTFDKYGNATSGKGDGSPGTVNVHVQDPPANTNVTVSSETDGGGGQKVTVTFAPNGGNKNASVPQEKNAPAPAEPKQPDTKQPETKQPDTKQPEPKQPETKEGNDKKVTTPYDTDGDGKLDKPVLPSTKYPKGYLADKELLDKIKKAGGTENAAGDVTFKGETYKKGEALTETQEKSLNGNAVNREEVSTGKYNQGDAMTPYLEEQLKANGYTKNEDGSFTSADKKHIIKPDSDNNLTKADADALENAGVNRSSGYDRTDPKRPFNTEAQHPQLMTEAQKTESGYPRALDDNPDHPPLVGQPGSDKNLNNTDPNAQAVYEYNEKTNQYEVVGELYSQGEKKKFYEYSEGQKKMVHDHEAKIGSGKLWPNS